MDKAKVAAGQLVEATEDRPEVFDLIDEALDKVVFLVEMAIMVSL